MLGQHRFQEVVDLFIDQIKGLVDGGSDVLIIETVQDILELKAAIHAAIRVREETGVYVPLQASITLDTSGRMLLGTDIAAALNIMEHMPVDIIGLNCSTGPDYMREPARYLGEYSTRPVSIIPNAGIPINVNGLAVFPMEPEPMARGLREMVEEFEVGIIGGCCGTTPQHIIEMSREIKTRPVMARPIKRLSQVASMIRAVDLQQNPAPNIVGERVNTLGSRKVKRLVLADDLDGIMSVATSQMEEGAHTLDVCVALTERTDEARHDAQAGQEAGAGGRRSARDRLDRSRCVEGCAGAVSRARHHQLHQYGKWPRQDRIGDAVGDGSRRGSDSADDR